MILEKRIVRLPDAESIFIYPIQNNQMILYVKNNTIKTKILTLSQIARCQPLKIGYDCDEIFRINDDMICLCQSDSMTLKKIDKEIL